LPWGDTGHEGFGTESWCSILGGGPALSEGGCWTTWEFKVPSIPQRSKCVDLKKTECLNISLYRQIAACPSFTDFKFLREHPICPTHFPEALSNNIRIASRLPVSLFYGSV
jgi:hypothetical protein